MRRPTFSSIRTALFATVLLAVLPALILVLHTGLEHSRHLEAEAREDALLTVESLGEIQDRITENTRQILATLALMPGFQSPERGPDCTCAAVLRKTLDDNPVFANVLKVSRAGGILVSPLPFEGVSIADRAHFRLAVETKRFSAGEYIVSRTTQEPVLPFAQPVPGQDGQTGNVLVAALRLSSYATLFKALRLPEDGFLVLADRNGTRIFHYPAKDRPPGQPVNPGLWAAVREGPDTGLVIRTGWDNVRRLVAYKRLRLTPAEEPYLTLILGLPLDAISAPARAVMIRNLALLAGVALLGLGGAWLLDRAVLGRRLKAVTETAARIQAGDLSARTGLPPSDTDLGLLAQALDSMAQALQERQAEQTQAAEATARSLREKETLLREIHHRVKNNLQLILSLVRLQSLHQEGNPVADFPARMENRVRAMALVHEMLYGSADLGGVDLSGYIPRLAQAVVKASTQPGGVRLSVDAIPARLVLDRAVPFALLLNELVTNACKHCARPDQACGLDVTLRAEGPDLLLRVADTGPGLPPDFDPEQSPSLGLRLVATLAEQLGGTLTWENRDGAVFLVRFPAG
jgi:two-component sensor histidine kinase/HAMP domain-containing protein